MADTQLQFRQIFLTYRDVKEHNPTWSTQMIEDYMATKQSIFITSVAADNAQDTADNAETIAETVSALSAQILQIRKEIGSNNPLTSDETGFTVDTDRLTVDMDEA